MRLLKWFQRVSAPRGLNWGPGIQRVPRDPALGAGLRPLPEAGGEF